MVLTWWLWAVLITQVWDIHSLTVTHTHYWVGCFTDFLATVSFNSCCQSSSRSLMQLQFQRHTSKAKVKSLQKISISLKGGYAVYLVIPAIFQTIEEPDQCSANHQLTARLTYGAFKTTSDSTSDNNYIFLIFSWKHTHTHTHTHCPWFHSTR